MRIYIFKDGFKHEVPDGGFLDKKIIYILESEHGDLVSVTYKGQTVICDRPC